MKRSGKLARRPKRRASILDRAVIYGESTFSKIKTVPMRRPKFGNVRRVYNGREYHSQKEARYAAELDLRCKAIGPHRINRWIPQVPVKLEVNGKLVTTYIVDFLVEHMDGRWEYVEVKGFETPEWRIKEKLFRALFPERQLTIVR